MVSHPKTYKEAICPDCGKKDIVRTDSKRKRCHTCAQKVKVYPFKWRFEGTMREYKKYHMRLRRAKGRASSCIFGCKASIYHWANLTGKHDDIDDYIQLCPTHHSLYDKGYITLEDMP